MATFGVATFLIGSAARSLDWFVPTYLSRIATLATLGVVVLVIRLRPRRGRCRGPDVLLAGGPRGNGRDRPATSAVFPLVPVAGGLLLFGERPTPLQLSGVGIVIAGLVLLGLGG